MNNRLEMVRRLKALAGSPASQAKPWYRIVNLDDDGPARVDVFDTIGGDWFSDGVTASGFTEALAAIPLTRAIECHINSPGGDVFDGLSIYNALAARPGPVTTVVDGLAASAASFIAQAGKTRLASPGSMMMIHDASGLAIGNAADMRELADLLDLVSGNLADIYAAHSGKPADGWRTAMQAETWYKAADAVSAGLADRLAERPAPEGATARHDLSMFARVPDWVRATDSNGGTDDRGRRRPAARRVLGIESMPLAAKALPVHHTATVDEAWDGPAAVKAMPADDTVLKFCHAWESDEAAAVPHQEGDEDADDVKDNYKFPHHKTDAAPANVSACNNGLSRLAGADIPEADRAGVEAHLRAHLDDAKGEDDSADDHAHLDLFSGVDLEQIGNLLKEAVS